MEGTATVAAPATVAVVTTPVAVAVAIAVVVHVTIAPVVVTTTIAAATIAASSAIAASTIAACTAALAALSTTVIVGTQLAAAHHVVPLVRPGGVVRSGEVDKARLGAALLRQELDHCHGAVLREVVLDVGLSNALGDVGNEEVLGGLWTTTSSAGRRPTAPRGAAVVSAQRRVLVPLVALLCERLGVLGELHGDLTAPHRLAILVADGI